MNSMEGRIENIVYFGIHNFECDIKIIANILEVPNYSGWSKGEHIPYRKNMISNSGVWEIKTPLDKISPLEEHLNWLTTILIPKVPQLNLIYKNYGATSELSIEISTYSVCNFGFHLDKELIQIINKLGTSLDIDIYNL